MSANEHNVQCVSPEDQFVWYAWQAEQSPSPFGHHYLSEEAMEHGSSEHTQGLQG